METTLLQEENQQDLPPPPNEDSTEPTSTAPLADQPNKDEENEPTFSSRPTSDPEPTSAQNLERGDTSDDLLDLLAQRTLLDEEPKQSNDSAENSDRCASSSSPERALRVSIQAPEPESHPFQVAPDQSPSSRLSKPRSSSSPTAHFSSRSEGSYFDKVLQGGILTSHSKIAADLIFAGKSAASITTTSSRFLSFGGGANSSTATLRQDTLDSVASSPRTRSSKLVGHASTSRSLLDVLDSDQLKVFTGTWNMQGKDPPENSLEPFIIPREHDIYVIGTQESERSIEASLIIRSKQKWEARLQTELGPNYKLLRSHTLMAIHIAVFVRKDLEPHITCVQSAHLSTGLLNGTVGNKGAVAVAFRLGDTSFLFVNSHFAAHEHKVQQRNEDFRNIDVGLAPLLEPRLDLSLKSWTADPILPSPVAGEESGSNSTEAQPPLPPPPSQPPSTASSSTASAQQRVTDKFDRVFWLGDLNYRINGNRKAIDALMKAGFFEVLLANDQLTLERKKGEVFVGFHEGELSFMPTYKFDSNSDTYDSSEKKRVPSWTDRILWKENVTPSISTSNSHFHFLHKKSHDSSKESQYSSAIQLLEYGSCSTLRTSDHRPVFAKFLVKFDGDGSIAIPQIQTKARSTVCAVM